jgi:type VI protein secretion system component VasF
MSDSGEITSAAATDSKEVKGNDKIDLDKKDDEQKEDESLPWWGIILLIVLVLVGAYLLFTQRPKNEPAGPAPLTNKPKGAPKKTLKK